MSCSVYLRQLIPAVLILASSIIYAQTDTEKIKAKWIIDKFESERNTAETDQTKKDLSGVCLTFKNDELTITRKTATGDSLIKTGPYFISGNSITLGKNQANILLLSEEHLTIQIPKQGTLYLIKM